MAPANETQPKLAVLIAPGELKFFFPFSLFALITSTRIDYRMENLELMRNLVECNCSHIKGHKFQRRLMSRELSVRSAFVFRDQLKLVPYSLSRHGPVCEPSSPLSCGIRPTTQHVCHIILMNHVFQIVTQRTTTGLRWWRWGIRGQTPELFSASRTRRNLKMFERSSPSVKSLGNGHFSSVQMIFLVRVAIYRTADNSCPISGPIC